MQYCSIIIFLAKKSNICYSRCRLIVKFCHFPPPNFRKILLKTVLRYIPELLSFFDNYFVKIMDIDCTTVTVEDFSTKVCRIFIGWPRSLRVFFSHFGWKPVHRLSIHLWHMFFLRWNFIFDTPLEPDTHIFIRKTLILHKMVKPQPNAHF